MSEENTASALGQIAFAEYHGRIAGGPLVMPDSWDMQSDAERADWEAAAVAVAAHVATPAAQDFDHAAEIMRLRGVLERLADEDTQVLGEGFGGGHAEENHVRASLAKQALGLPVECCTECMVSLGLEPDDEEGDQHWEHNPEVTE